MKTYLLNNLNWQIIKDSEKFSISTIFLDKSYEYFCKITDEDVLSNDFILNIKVSIVETVCSELIKALIEEPYEFKAKVKEGDEIVVKDYIVKAISKERLNFLENPLKILFGDKVL